MKEKSTNTEERDAKEKVKQTMNQLRGLTRTSP